MRVEITVHGNYEDRALLDDLIAESERKFLRSNGISMKLLYRGERRGFPPPFPPPPPSIVVQLALTFATTVAAEVLANWLYDILKNRAKKIKIEEEWLFELDKEKIKRIIIKKLENRE